MSRSLEELNKMAQDAGAVMVFRVLADNSTVPEILWVDKDPEGAPLWLIRIMDQEWMVPASRFMDALIAAKPEVTEGVATNA